MKESNFWSADKPIIPQVLSLLAGFTMFVQSIRLSLESTAEYNPFYLRLSVGALGILLFITPFFVPIVKRNINNIFGLYAFLFLCVIFVLLFKNNFPEHYILSFFICTIGLSIAFDRRIYFYVTLGTVMTIAITFFILSNTQHLNDYLFISQTLAVGLITLLVGNVLAYSRKRINETSANFDVMLKNSNELFFVIGLDYTILHINNVAKDMLKSIVGIAVEKGMNYKDFSHGENFQFFQEHMKGAIDGERLILDREIKLDSGFALWTEVKYTPIYNKEGDVTAVLHSILDISKRKKIEQTLHEQNVFNKGIFSAIPSSIYVVDLDKLRFNWIVNKISDELGYPDMKPNKILMKYTDSNDVTKIEKIFFDLKKGDFIGLPRFEFKIKNSKGTWEWYSVRLNKYVEDEKGNHREVIGLVQNITVIKESNLRIAESERKFRELFDNAPIPIAIATLGGYFVSVNKAFEHTLGYTMEDLDEKSFFDITFQNDKLLNKNTLEKAIGDNDDQYALEKRYVHKDGSILETLIKTNIITSEIDQEKYLLGQIVDITQMKKFEHEIQDKNVKLEKINEELDKFVYSTAHDLKAPLNSIQGLIYISKNAKSDQERNELLEMMNQSVEKLLTFIKDITDYSKNNKLEVKLQVLDVHLKVNEVLSLLSHSKEAEHIEAQVLIPEDFKIQTDDYRFGIVLHNIISNAIKYHDNSKENQYIKIKSWSDEKFNVLSIEDNGLGIDQDDQKKIFQLFYRGSELAKGSGLGLYIVKDIMQKLKGELELESDLGVGTTFTLKFYK